jgi:hypothetical protein
MSVYLDDHCLGPHFGPVPGAVMTPKKLIEGQCSSRNMQSSHLEKLEQMETLRVVAILD